MMRKIALLSVLTVAACATSPAPILTDETNAIPCDKIAPVTFAYGDDEIEDRAADPNNQFDTPETVTDLIYLNDSVIRPACPRYQ